MKQICAGMTTGSFPAAPENVTTATIDARSGLLPSDLSSLDKKEWTIRSEYFIKGTEPTEIDNVHTYVNVCSESGYLATPFCYNRISAFGVKRPYIPNPIVDDIKYEVPHYYCFIHNNDTETYPINEEALWNYNWEGMEITSDPPEPDFPEYPEWPPYEDPSTEPDSDPDSLSPDFNYEEMPQNLRP